MSATQARRVREKAALAIVLSWVAGLVDAIGYLTLFHLFTAHMSGNSVATGVALGQGGWAMALRRATPIPLFVVGVMLGAALVEAAARRGLRSTLSVALAPVVALLVAFMTLGTVLLRDTTVRPDTTWQFYLLVALPTLAMGCQNAALRRVGGRYVRITYVTGMLTNLAEQAVVFLYWLRDRTRGRGIRRLALALRLAPRRPAFVHGALYGGIWLGYILGAIVGGVSDMRWALRALLIPLCSLALVIALDLVRPAHAAKPDEALS